MFAIASTPCIFVRNLMLLWTDAIHLFYNNADVFSSCVYFLEYLQLEHIALPHQMGVATRFL